MFATWPPYFQNSHFLLLLFPNHQTISNIQLLSTQLPAEVRRRCKLWCVALALKITRSSNLMGILAKSFGEDAFELSPKKYEKSDDRHREQAKFTLVSLRDNHKVAALLQPLFGKVSSRNVVFPSLASSESPRRDRGIPTCAAKP